MRACVALHVSLLTLLFGDVGVRIENSNFTLSEQLEEPDKRYTYNYDRLRLNANITEGTYFAALIADGVHDYGAAYVKSAYYEFKKSLHSDTPFKTQSELRRYGNGAYYGKLHRLYGGYDDFSHRVVAGIQKISMGVGRIWTPTDLFNPKNSYALEADEVFGVAALSYRYALSDVGRISVVASQRENHSIKIAASFKSFWEYADVGVNLIRSDETLMLGYEVEGNLFDTGIEWRSEGGWFENTLLDHKLFQAIAGVDYGFENGVTWVIEGYYSSETFDAVHAIANYQSDIASIMIPSHFYAGTTLSYALNLCFDLSLLYVQDGEHNRFVAPLVNYTLNDFSTFSLGAMHSSGSQEQMGYTDTLYFKWFLSFNAL